MRTKHIMIITLLLTTLIIPLVQEANAIPEYYEDFSYIIPWGNPFGSVSGELSTIWTVDPDSPDWGGGVAPPEQWVVTNSGELVIMDCTDVGTVFMKFNSNGLITHNFNFYNAELRPPSYFAVTDSGEVLFENRIKVNNSMITSLYFLNSNFELSNSATIPIPDAFLYEISPSNSSSFYILFEVSLRDSYHNIRYERYLTEYLPDGTLTTPQLLFSGSGDDPDRNQYEFVTPDGQILPRKENIYGFTYESTTTNYHVLSFDVYSPEFGLIHSHQFQDDPEWWFDYCSLSRYLSTWSGDFYTLHATDAGAVFIKYDLHVDPVCNLIVVTPPPYSGPSPVAVEFDASGTYDDDGDTLTFHWDFDGDKVFDEPIDDAYTGTPENPTHEYTADYEGAVNLRVTDNYQGECDIAVILSVDVE